MITPKEDGDHSQLAQEVVEPPDRPREVQRDRIEPQVLADQVGSDQQHEDHGEEELNVEELAERQRPHRRPKPSRAGPELFGQILEKEHQRRQQP